MAPTFRNTSWKNAPYWEEYQCVRGKSCQENFRRRVILFRAVQLLLLNAPSSIRPLATSGQGRLWLEEGVRTWKKKHTARLIWRGVPNKKCMGGVQCHTACCSYHSKLLPMQTGGPRSWYLGQDQFHWWGINNMSSNTRDPSPSGLVSNWRVSNCMDCFHQQPLQSPVCLGLLMVLYQLTSP